LERQQWTTHDTSAEIARRRGGTIITPGRNCWRVEKASRAAVLVDGADYFSRLETALRAARSSILILGWDFDGSIRLRPDASEQESPPLGPLLRSLAEDNPDLQIRILVWSVAVVHAPGAPGPLIFGAEWQNHPRIELRLDTHHPIYAAHHQKVVTVDGTLAFAGGIDLTVRRWDTCRHASDDPLRARNDGSIYDPVHDIQMVVEGEAAQALEVLALDRWEAALCRKQTTFGPGTSIPTSRTCPSRLPEHIRRLERSRPCAKQPASRLTRWQRPSAPSTSRLST
jgi:phosphatidylserine/phosphatidylglycerophosphate/cardiolipin synthase-like enzyme